MVIGVLTSVAVPLMSLFVLLAPLRLGFYLWSCLIVYRFIMGITPILFFHLSNPLWGVVGFLGFCPRFVAIVLGGGPPYSPVTPLFF